MRLLWRASLLAGLMFRFGRAGSPEANMDIWTIDESCTNYFDGAVDAEYSWGKKGGEDQSDFLQEIFTVALQAAIAGQESMKFALGKRPDSKTDEKGYLKWIRIADSMAVSLGIIPKPAEEESADDKYWKTVFDIVNKMVKTLQSSENDPAHGYNPELSALTRAKPLLVCGDNWQWLDPDDEIADYDNKKLKDVKILKGGAVGAWYKHHRFIFKAERREKPILCDGETLAQVDGERDIMVLCDDVFTDEGIREDWPTKEEIGETYSLGDMEFTSQDAATHELLHWFSGVKDLIDFEFELDDVDRVDKNGYLVYEKEDNKDETVLKATPLTKKEMAKEGLIIKKSYGLKDVWNLAKIHTGETAANTGPAKATNNAESITLFLVMMYFDEWNWAYRGRARKPGKVYNN